MQRAGNPKKGPLPTFLIIGAPRSGTTTLYHWLQQHPDVFMSAVKEPNYFAFAGHDHLLFEGRSYPLKSCSYEWESYTGLFTMSSGFSAVGEASTSYLSSTFAPEMIRTRLPDVKLIAVLRNPVERAYSHYLMGVRDGWAPASFARALQLEAEEMETDHAAPTALNHFYLRGGHYADQLSRYSRELQSGQLRVHLFEELKHQPGSLVRSIYEFLGVSVAFTPDTSHRLNTFGKPRFPMIHHWLSQQSYDHPLRKAARRILPRHMRSNFQFRAQAKPMLSSDVRERLKSYFLPQIERTEELTGLDLGHWLD